MSVIKSGLFVLHVLFGSHICILHKNPHNGRWLHISQNKIRYSMNSFLLWKKIVAFPNADGRNSTIYTLNRERNKYLA